LPRQLRARRVHDDACPAPPPGSWNLTLRSKSLIASSAIFSPLEFWPLVPAMFPARVCCLTWRRVGPRRGFDVRRDEVNELDPTASHSVAYCVLLSAVPHQANRRKPLVFAFLFAVLASGAPDTIRTYDLGFRKALLYPAELRERFEIWGAEVVTFGGAAQGVTQRGAGCFVRLTASFFRVCWESCVTLLRVLPRPAFFRARIRRGRGLRIGRAGACHRRCCRC
jgi:hypothetical protein